MVAFRLTGSESERAFLSLLFAAPISEMESAVDCIDFCAPSAEFDCPSLLTFEELALLPAVEFCDLLKDESF